MDHKKIVLKFVTKGKFLSIKDCKTGKMNKRIKIESKLTSLRIVENAIDEITTSLGIRQKDYGKILVSTLEAVNNAILHGNDSNPKKYVYIEINYTNKQLRVKVSDEGVGFKPNNLPDPTTPDNIEEINGRGVFLMSHLADRIRYSKRGNAVTMTFKNIIT